MIKRTFYKDNGFQLNKEGLELSKTAETAIESIYSYWLQRGYSPSEARELLFSKVFEVTTFANAMHFSK